MYTLTKADMLAQLAGLQQEIHQLHRSARQDRRHFSLLERRFSRLQAFNDLPQLQAYRRKLENDRSITAQITQLRAVANAALCDYEKHRVATLCREPAQTNAYLNNFDSALQLEIAAADIKPGERVLLVGSGACPPPRWRWSPGSPPPSFATIATRRPSVLPAASRAIWGCHGKSSASIN